MQHKAQNDDDDCDDDKLPDTHFNTTLRCISYTLLTPWKRVLPEKLTGLQLVKKFPAFYGTRRFISAFTSAGHMSLSSAN